MTMQEQGCVVRRSACSKFRCVGMQYPETEPCMPHDEVAKVLWARIASRSLGSLSANSARAKAMRA